MSFHFDEASWWAGLEKVRFELEMGEACPELVQLAALEQVFTLPAIMGDSYSFSPVTESVVQERRTGLSCSGVRDVQVREGLIQRIDESGRILDTYDDHIDDHEFIYLQE